MTILVNLDKFNRMMFGMDKNLHTYTNKNKN